MDSTAFISRGYAKYMLGEYLAAIEDFNKAIELNPKYSDALNGRGLAKYRLGEYSAAIEDFNKAIELDPKDSTAFNNRGLAKYSLGEYSAAIEDFNKVIELDPKNSYALVGRGVSHCLLERYEECLKDCSKSIELDPKFYYGFLRRGIAFLLLRKYEEAIKDIDQAVQLLPNDSEPPMGQLLLARYVKKGNDESEKWIQQIDEHYKKAENRQKIQEAQFVHFMLGFVAYQMNDKGRAKNAFEAALSFGEYLPARNKLESLSKEARECSST